MGKILTIANQKGGVGKTTTSVNLAASLAATRRRVLLIDLDPQGNATMGSAVDKHDLEFTSGDVLLGRVSIREAIQYVEAVGFSLLPANGDLTEAEVALMQAERREFRLKEALAPVAGEFDYIIIDCPPALNMLTVNALVAAHGVVIPMQCEYYALEGLTALTGTIESIRRSVNPDLEIEGVLRTMYDPRNNLATDVSAQLEQHCGDRLYQTIIPRNVRLAEAPSYGLPILLYDTSSRGAQAYVALAGEILRRHRGDPPATAATGSN